MRAKVSAPAAEEIVKRDSRREGDNSGSPALTGRESEILRSLAEGLRLQEIASHFDVSFYTVVSHLRSIYDKLGVHNRSSAVAVARKRLLI